MRHNATLREIFGDDNFFEATIQLEIDYKLSSESVKITCMGLGNLTVLDNKGHKVVIARNTSKDVHVSRKRAFVSRE